MQAIDVGPAPPVEDAGSVDQHMGLIFDGYAILLDLNFPFPGPGVPNCGDDLAVQLNTFVKSVFIRRPLDIVPNFGTFGVE